MTVGHAVAVIHAGTAGASGEGVPMIMERSDPRIERSLR